MQTRKSKTGVRSSGCSGSPQTSTSEPSPKGSALSCTITATVCTCCTSAILPQSWQKINERWHSCHSWRDLDGSSITAMTYFIILLVIAAVMAAKTIDLLRHDGRGPAAPPSSHFQDPHVRRPRLRSVKAPPPATHDDEGPVT